MKHDSASAIRKAAADRLGERVEALQRAAREARPVPVPGDPPPGQSALDRKRAFEEQHAMAICLAAKALRQSRDGNRNLFGPARQLSDRARFAGASTVVHRDVIQRLVDKGQLRWVNSAHSAAVAVEDAR